MRGTKKMDSHAGEGEGDDRVVEPTAPPPRGAVVGPHYSPPISDMTSIAEKDFTCFGIMPVNELLFVYIALFCGK